MGDGSSNLLLKIWVIAVIQSVSDPKIAAIKEGVGYLMGGVRYRESNSPHLIVAIDTIPVVVVASLANRVADVLNLQARDAAPITGKSAKSILSGDGDG